MKYFQQTEFGRIPIKATEESVGYDLFASHSKTILPGQSAKVSLDLHWAIPTGFCGRVLSRSSLVTEDSVTVESGLIDSDFRGAVNVILFNHAREKCFTIKEGQRIAQVVFIRKSDADFVAVISLEKLGQTERQEGGFGSTGKTVIKKIRLEPESEKPESDQATVELEIKSEEAILTENDDKLIIHQKIIINFLDMEINEYLIFIIWFVTVLVFYKIFQYLSQLFTNCEIKNIDNFFDSYGGKNC